MVGVDDDPARQAADDAWDGVEALLDDGPFDAAALTRFQYAERLLRPFGDDGALERRAWLLESIVFCHAGLGDGKAAARAARRALDGEWPAGALAPRLSAVTIAAAAGALPRSQRAALTDQAIALAAASSSPQCERFAAMLLRAQVYWALEAGDLDGAIARLQRISEEFADVDDESDADDAPPAAFQRYLEALRLIEQPGRLPDAAQALREAGAAGYPGAWLELGIVLGWQGGREREEEAALRQALAAERDPEHLARAGVMLGELLLFGSGDRDGARAAFGRATTGEGGYAIEGVKSLIQLAVLDGDEEARRQLVSELAGRLFEADDPDARRKDYPRLASIARLGYRPWMTRWERYRWRRRRRRTQREFAELAAGRPRDAS